ncbi:hypothetical protein B4Q04_05280 [Zobellia sp. OII3]|uniref:hypothetical protein n=1 Tax=Zobellia sp. OII3 TaxID=2034520 RepID=UPI000B52CCDF|nr:hypothetical protein [Zobellia sp. OII3]OWW27089.1 hypothetical protein B4Q04_05280 [Zobellia sp. OII3]
MRSLLSSLCLFLWVGCASYPAKNGFEPRTESSQELQNPYFSNPEKDYVYKAKIDAFNKSFGGIFIVKKLGPDHHRIAFTTEIGNTIFDFTFKENDFVVNRILKELDKKVLINILKRDFKALIQEQSQVRNQFSLDGDTVLQSDILSKKHYFYYKRGQLNRIARVDRNQKKVEFFFSNIDDQFAKEIEIAHYNFKLHITLKSFK